MAPVRSYGKWDVRKTDNEKPDENYRVRHTRGPSCVKPLAQHVECS